MDNNFTASDKNYWNSLINLLKNNKIVIDRPKGTSHPKYHEMIYPLDYGYVENTKSMDKNEIDIFIGSISNESILGIICTFDKCKNDSEIKIMYNCTESDLNIVLAFLNSKYLSAIFIRNPFFS
jgi:inorganic pyrophosphatase